MKEEIIMQYKNVTIFRTFNESTSDLSITCNMKAPSILKP